MFLDNVHIITIILPLIMGFFSFLIKDKFLKFVNLLYLIIFSLFFIYILYSIFHIDVNKDYLTVIGGWEKPIGIELKFNFKYSINILLLTLIMMVFLSATYRSIGYAFRGFACIMLCGANGIILSNDIFNSYVFFEIICITTYIMYSYGNNVVCLKNVYDYAILSSFVGVVFLIVISFLYQITGNLNIDIIHNHIDSLFSTNKSISAIYIIFILSIIVKMGTYPFHGILFRIYKNISFKYLMFIAGVSSIVYPCFVIKIVSQLFGNNVIINNEYISITLKIFGIIGFLFFNFSAFLTKSVLEFIIFLSFSQVSLFTFCIPYFVNKQVIDGVNFIIISNSVIKTCMFAILYKIKEQTKILDFTKDTISYINNNFYKILFIILLFIMSGMPISIVFFAKWYILSGIFTVSDNFLYFFAIIIGFIIDIIACFSFIKKIISSNNDNFLDVKTDYLFILIMLLIIILLFTLII